MKKRKRKSPKTAVRTVKAFCTGYSVLGAYTRALMLKIDNMPEHSPVGKIVEVRWVDWVPTKGKP